MSLLCEDYKIISYFYEFIIYTRAMWVKKIIKREEMEIFLGGSH